MVAEDGCQWSEIVLRGGYRLPGLVSIHQWWEMVGVCQMWLLVAGSNGPISDRWRWQSTTRYGDWRSWPKMVAGCEMWWSEKVIGDCGWRLVVTGCGGKWRWAMGGGWRGWEEEGMKTFFINKWTNFFWLQKYSKFCKLFTTFKIWSFVSSF